MDRGLQHHILYPLATSGPKRPIRLLKSTIKFPVQFGGTIPLDIPDTLPNAWLGMQSCALLAVPFENLNSTQISSGIWHLSWVMLGLF